MTTTTTVEYTNAAGKTERRTFYSVRSLIAHLNRELRRARIMKATSMNSFDFSLADKAERGIQKILDIYKEPETADKIERRLS